MPSGLTLHSTVPSTHPSELMLRRRGSISGSGGGEYERRSSTDTCIPPWERNQREAVEE